MKSSRQKKRVSQQKKRHHEHVKAKGDSTGTTLAGKHVKENSAGTSPPASRQERERLSSSKDQLDAPEKVINFLASRIITYIFVVYKGSRQQSFQNTKRS